MYFSPVHIRQSKATNSHRKKFFDILRLKSTALYSECKGSLKDVQLKRGPVSV